jgi:PAS domain S-box-containing protein
MNKTGLFKKKENENERNKNEAFERICSIDEESKKLKCEVMETSSRIITKLSQTAASNIRSVVQVIEDVSLDAIFSTDYNGNIITVNNAGLNIFGYSVDELPKIKIQDLIPDLHNRDVTSEPKWHEAVAIKKNGTFFPVEIITNFLAHSSIDISLRTSLSICRDISYSKKLEKETINLGLIINSLIQKTPMPFYHKDVNLRFVGCNDLFEKLMGVSFKEIFGKTSEELWPEYELAGSSNELGIRLIKGIDQKQIVTANNVVNKRTGEYMNIVVYSTAIHDAYNNITGIFGTILNLKDYLKLNQPVEFIEEALYENNTPYFITDKEGKVKYINKACAKAIEYTSDEVVDRNTSLFMQNIKDNKILVTNRFGTQNIFNIETIQIANIDPNICNFVNILTQ